MFNGTYRGPVANCYSRVWGSCCSGAKEVAIFATASEYFSGSNINCSAKDSLSRYHDVAFAGRNSSIPVHVYISCIVGCPLEGAVSPSQVVYVVNDFLNTGCIEISIGDMT